MRKLLERLSTTDLIKQYDSTKSVILATRIVAILLDRAEMGDIESQRFFELSVN